MSSSETENVIVEYVELDEFIGNHPQPTQHQQQQQEELRDDDQDDEDNEDNDNGRSEPANNGTHCSSQVKEEPECETQQHFMLQQQADCSSNLEALAQAAAAASENQRMEAMTSPPSSSSLLLMPSISSSSSSKRRRQRRPIPEEKKDEKYWRRRVKNNAAAQRSREAKREKENKMSIKASFLEREHQVLVSEVERARDLNRELRERLSKYEKC